MEKQQQQQQQQPSQMMPAPVAARTCWYTGYKRNIFAVIVWLCLLAQQANNVHVAKQVMDATGRFGHRESSYIGQFALSILYLAVHFLAFFGMCVKPDMIHGAKKIRNIFAISALIAAIKVSMVICLHVRFGGDSTWSFISLYTKCFLYGAVFFKLIETRSDFSLFLQAVRPVKA